MAFQLGFHVIDTRSQFISPSVDATSLEEVRSELGYLDLTSDLTPSDRIISQFATVLPSVASARAEAWQETAPAVLDLFDTLREDSLSDFDRNVVMTELRERNETLGRQGGW